jgi:large subunit ribosomal protein L6
MSKIGKQPIKIPQGVIVALEGSLVKVKGGKGELINKIPLGIKVEISDNQILLTKKEGQGEVGAIYGTYRAILANAVKGVSEGWVRVLELVGTGYRAETNGKELTLTVGYSQPIKIKAPEDVNFKVEKNIITVEGIDKEVVGGISAKIRAVRPPEPYKGKGILYQGEVIRRKAGKAAKAQGAPA